VVIDEPERGEQGDRMTRMDRERRRESAGHTPPSAGETSGEDTSGEKRAPSPMEFSSLPLDPIYAWGIVLEPVETLIEHTSDFVEQLARETYARGDPLSDEELERRFLAFFDRLVEEGTLRRLPDAPPEMGRRILGPRRWLRAQQIRIKQWVRYWTEHGGPD
jgi:hypothetical protein